jgi:hypothetical protein
MDISDVVLADVGARRKSKLGRLGPVGEQEADGLSECLQVGGIR